MNTQQLSTSTCYAAYSSASALGGSTQSLGPSSGHELASPPVQYTRHDGHHSMVKNARQTSSSGRMRHAEVSIHPSAAGPSRQTATHSTVLLIGQAVPQPDASTVLLICQVVPQPDAGHSQGFPRNRNHQSHPRVLERYLMVQAVCNLQQWNVHDRGNQTACQHHHGHLHHQMWCIVSGGSLPHCLSSAGP